jgi:hypothetical protein
METKTKIVKEYLEAGNSITDMKAVELCQSYRLSGIIFNLRHSYGMNIQDRWLENENTGSRYKEYYLLNVNRK